MHYKISKDILIKTENAAKPEKQGSRFLNEYIQELGRTATAFDYGCGKLRYKKSILETSDTLTLVDSEIQISRQQMLCGKHTSIRDMFKASNRVTVMEVGEFSSNRQKFDRGFCINVMSVIPFLSVRKRAAKTIFEKLRPGGSCLFVVQYRNSDFDRMRRMQNAQSWKDGILIDSLRGHSFYALIRPEKLEALIKGAGFLIESQKLNEGSAYIMAKRAK